MRKVLFALITCLLLLISAILIAIGVNKGLLKVWGIKQIRQENIAIDSANNKLSGMVNNEYPDAVDKLNESAESMQKSKTGYENKVLLLSNSDYYMQTEEYEIEFLWTKIGNYAKDNKVEMKMEVTKSKLEGRYDLNFTFEGEYSDITQLIYDIENDSKLGFKIEDFKMVAEGAQSTTENSGKTGYVVKGTFSCKDIRVNIDESKLKSATKTTGSSDEKLEKDLTSKNTNTSANTADSNTVDSNNNNTVNAEKKTTTTTAAEAAAAESSATSENAEEISGIE